MATLRDAEQLTQELEELAARLHSELTNGEVDFTKLMRLADRLGASADALASTFEAIDEALMQRLPGGSEQQDESQSEGNGQARRGRRQRRRSSGGDENNETRDELLERARQAGIEGRSGMSKDELRKALEAEESLSKEDLLERAREADIPGRSEMSKDELKEALRTA
jgi:hypothetical protein